MKIHPVALFFIGVILGIGCTVLAFNVAAEKEERGQEAILFADGFRNINYANGRVTIELVSKVDNDTIEISKTLEVPSEGFFRGYHAMEQLVNKLANDGIISRQPEESGAAPSTDPVEPPSE